MEWNRIGSQFNLAATVVVLSLLVTLIPSEVVSYRTGAPSAACSTLTPNHGVSTQAASTLPYRIDTDVFQDMNSGALLYTPGFTYDGNPFNI